MAYQNKPYKMYGFDAPEQSAALSYQIDLRSSLNSLVEEIKVRRRIPGHIIDSLESMQNDVQGLRRGFNNSEFLIHHRHLMLDLATLADDLQKQRIGYDELLECLELCRDDVDGIEHIFRAHMERRPQLRTYWRDAGSIIAETVFAIPEILEMILSQCPTTSVLSFTHMYKGARDIIKASPKLQVHNFQRPADQASSRRYPFERDDMPNFE